MPGENCPVCQQYFTKKEIRRHIINCRMRRAFNIYSQVEQKLTLSQQGHFTSNPYVSDDLSNHETQHQSSTDIVNNNPADILRTNHCDFSNSVDMNSLDECDSIANEEENSEKTKVIQEGWRTVGAIEEDAIKKTTVEEIYSRLSKFKDTITHPIQLKIKDDGKQYMDILSPPERKSLELKYLLKENNVSKSTTEKIFNFFNEYLIEMNSGIVIISILLLYYYQCAHCYSYFLL